MTLVFNELSAGHGERTRNEAMDLMSHVVKAIAALVRKRADREQASTVTDEMVNRAQAGLAESPRTLLTVIRPSFPHLRFGLDVEGQIATLPADVLEPIITKLVVLDGAIRDWRRDGPKLPGLPMIHPESEQTMQRYGAQRVFRSSNGKQATFRLHAMVGGAYRIHVRIDQRRRSLEIGYIGKHLPTARFPT